VLGEGDYLCVYAAAQYPGWECHGREGLMSIVMRWEPVLFPRQSK
jgi:hypothetical protein